MDIVHFSEMMNVQHQFPMGNSTYWQNLTLPFDSRLFLQLELMYNSILIILEIARIALSPSNRNLQVLIIFNN